MLQPPAGECAFIGSGREEGEDMPIERKTCAEWRDCARMSKTYEVEQRRGRTEGKKEAHDQTPIKAPEMELY